MSGSRPHAAERGLSEQHLGDRLAAFVDGELGHDARERVLSHLASCARCKADADAQRRLKSVFAQAAPPPPSQSFLERLQGLPGEPAGGSGPFGGPGGAWGEDPFAGAPYGVTDRDGRAQEARETRSAFPGGFAYVPARPHGTLHGTPHGAGRSAFAAAASAGPGRGFRVHDLGRPEQGLGRSEQSEAARTASRGRRFAFAAAGAVSLAALALGGVSSGAPTDSPAEARGSNATPQRTASALGQPGETARRRATGAPAPMGAQGGARSVPVRPTLLAAPLVPGGPRAVTGVRPPLLPGSAPVYAAVALGTAARSGVPDTFLRLPAEEQAVSAEALPSPSAVRSGRMALPGR